MGEGLYNWNIERLNSQADGYGLNFWVDDQLPTGPGERAGTSTLFLGSNRKVGVGTKTPTTTFEVAGGFKSRTAEVTNTLTANALTVQAANITETLSVNALTAQSANITSKNLTNGFSMSYNNTNLLLRQQEQGKFSIEGPEGGLMIAPNGNIGMGTDIPKQKLHIVDGNILISKTSAKAPGCPNGSILFGADITTNTMGKWGIEYLNGEDNAFGLNFWKPWNPGEGGSGDYILFLGNDKNVGIGMKNPSAKLDVAGNVRINSGIQTLSLGSAYHQNLSYGTSYIGFNAKRDNGNWTLDGDGANNGGAVIWATVDGSILFASIPRTSGSTQTIVDSEVKDYIKLYLTPNGVLKAKEVLVTLTGWPDYVFSEDYKLPALSEVEQFVAEN